MKKVVIDLLKNELKMKAWAARGIPSEKGTGVPSLSGKIENLLEVPPSGEMGDYAFPCFALAKSLRKNPMEIAKELAEKLRKKGLGKGMEGVDFKGPYVNFFIDKKILAEGVLKSVGKKGFGENSSGKGKNIVIDMSSPNIAKPFGIGHLRSTIIGNSIWKICEANGYKVTKINYLGDWGTQFGKMIFGFKKWGNEKKLGEDTIKHLLEIYVKANAKEHEEAAREEFKKLEGGDKDNLKMWEKFRKLSLKEFDSIYDLLGVEFDVISGESKYNDKMDAVVAELKKKKIVKKDDGALIVDLKDEGLGVALIQKSDGTSLYATRDIAAAIDRKKEYKFHRLIYEVGQEQKLHFNQFFKILDMMGHSWSKDCVHVAHGLYLGEGGKKFATRKGKTVFMSDILDDTIERARKNLMAREKLTKEELEKRAKKIALAAIFYGDLKNSRENNIIFDIDRFLAFEGDTGPYLLYSYARASSILRRVKLKKAMKIIDLKKEEIKLLKKIDGFGKVIEKAYNQLAPNLIANYCYELAQTFNEFYHGCPVLGSAEEGFRLKLVDSFRVVMKNGLDLLGIGVLEEM